MALIDENTAAEFAWLREHWDELLAARHRGTKRPWREYVMSAEDRAVEDAMARAERLNPHRGVAPGWGMAPPLLDVVQTIADIEMAVLSLEDAIRAELGYTRLCSRCRHENSAHVGPGYCRLHPNSGDDVRCPCPGYRLDRAPREGRAEWRLAEARLGSVKWATRWVEQVGAALTEELADDAAAVAWECGKQARRSLQLVDPSVLIKAPCPWCRGVSADNPAGGFTMRLYTKDGTEDAYLTCTNPGCEPPEGACGMRKHGRPAWPPHEWDYVIGKMDAPHAESGL